MLFQIRIGNQKIQISQVKNMRQFQIKLANSFDYKKYIGLSRIFNEKQFPKFCQRLSTSNSQNFEIVYDSPSNITLFFKRKYKQIFKLEQSLYAEEDQQKRQQLITQSQSIFDNQNLPKELLPQIKRKYPFTAMAEIFATFPKGQQFEKSQAKGFLITPYLIATCAHSIMIGNIQAVSVQVSFPNKKNEIIKASRWFISKQYRNNPEGLNAYRYDYALIVLQKSINYKPMKIMMNIDRKYVLASIAANQLQENTRKKFGLKIRTKMNVITGNQQFGIYATENKYSFQQSYNYADLRRDDDLIYHMVATQKGISGSQMFIELTQGQYHAIAIHVAAYSYGIQDEGNLAVRFNDRIVKQFKQWQEVLVHQTEQPVMKSKLQKQRIQFVQYKDHQFNDKNIGFALINYERQIKQLKQEAHELKQKGQIQKASKKRKQLLDHHKIYKNDDIAQIVSNEILKFAQQNIQIYRQKKKRADELYNRTGLKFSNKCRTILDKANKEIAQSAHLLDKTSIRLEYQLLSKQFQRLTIQFHRQNENYKKQSAFKTMIDTIEQEKQLLDNKYEQHQTKQLKEDFSKLKSKVHYYLGICYTDKNKRKMAKAYEQFIIAKNILNTLEQSDIDEHFKINQEIISLCIHQHQKVEKKFEDCFKEGVQGVRFIIDKAHYGNQKAEKYLDLASQFIHFMLTIHKLDILASIKTILLEYKDSKAISVKSFTQKKLKLLPKKI